MALIVNSGAKPGQPRYCMKDESLRGSTGRNREGKGWGWVQVRIPALFQKHKFSGRE